jgi:succinyldiaminopimelate transaminase
MSASTPPSVPTAWSPPPYPYDRLEPAKRAASRHDGGVVDLSVGSPCDPPPAAVVAALAGSGSERGYPPSVGTERLRRSISAWFDRRFGLDVDPAGVAATIGTKEFVATTPGYLRLRRPDRDTVLYPSVAYPTYAMGAELAGLRAVPVAVDDAFRLRLDAIDPADAARALCLWVNTPGNPDGHLDDLAAAAAWGRAHGVDVLSDECYVEFTWDGPPRTILAATAPGSDPFAGVLAVHSLSKRSNLAGVRVGFYAGDAALVHFLSEVRKHAGFMVPGPAQAAGAVALDDDAHVAEQRERYRRRLVRCAELLGAWSGLDIALPAGGFYLWFDVTARRRDGSPSPFVDGWDFAERLAAEGGALVSPGDLYGSAGSQYVRVAVVQPDDAIERMGRRLGVAP